MPRDAIRRHEKLQAWVACHELTLAVYRSSRGWPPAECFGLTLQCRRSAYSAAASIAAGAARPGVREFRRNLDRALGNLAELDYALRLARELEYLPPERWGEVEALRDHASRLAAGLQRALGRRPGGGT